LVLEEKAKYYIVEMQIWSIWSRYSSGDLLWNTIINEGVTLIPRVLAAKVKVGGKEVPVSGFCYVTYSRGPDHSAMDLFKTITAREFKLLYI
jgi:hypothetical protein